MPGPVGWLLSGRNSIGEFLPLSIFGWPLQFVWEQLRGGGRVIWLVMTGSLASCLFPFSHLLVGLLSSDARIFPRRVG